LLVGQTDPTPSVQDTTALPVDPIAMDSLVRSDTTVLPQDSIPPSRQNDIETTVNYNAQDSMFFDLKNQRMTMYGDTHIDYGMIKLDAERTEVDWIKRTIKADFVSDSTGNVKGKPVFTDGGDVYETKGIVYDFKSRKAKISGVITEQDGAIMHGSNVKKNEEDEMFITGALYTTCTLANPHFFIESKRLKVIPGNKVVTGPFHMKFREVPTPLWGPFGMFPQPKKKASGILVPTYGEERLRGFFLRGGGYYFAMNDYMDLRVTGDIYSKGGYGFQVNQNYFKRYGYRGAFNYSFTKNVIGTLVNEAEQNSYWIRWNHSPQSQGNSRFSASVSMGSTSYNQNNNLAIQGQRGFQQSIQSTFSSNVSYSNKLQGLPYNLSSSARLTQTVQTGIVQLTLPDMTLNMTRIYPLKGVAKSSNSPLSKLSFSHTFAARNELTNAPRTGLSGFEIANENSDASDTLRFNLANWSEIQQRSRLGARHTIPITTSMTVLKYFTLSPTFNYQEVWYGRELKFTDYDQEAGGVRVDTLDTFSRAGSWTSSASLNTRLYGMYNVGALNIQAIRHVITPSVSFSYNPDFSSTKYGVYSDVQIDSLGNTRRLSKYEGFIFGSPSGQESKTMSFSITNNLEMKVLDKSDSTGESFKKIKIFENLSASSGYNFAADSFKLNNIALSARTSFLKGKLGITTNATIDPYIYKLNSKEGGVVDQRRLDRYAWNNGQGLGQISSFRAAINLNLQGKSKSTASKDVENQQRRQGRLDPSLTDPLNDPLNDPLYQQDEQVQQIVDHIRNNPEEYIDFKVPWSLRTNYSFQRRKTGFQSPTVTKTMTFGGSLGLTDKTQITWNSGYDFDNNEFTTTRISVHRDLHCWVMDFNWVPFGTYQSYMLTIRVKAPMLQDLKVEKRKSNIDFFGDSQF
jgi:hypothetical protein